MKFGRTDTALSKRLREIVHAADSLYSEDGIPDMEAFEALAEWLSESQLIKTRAVHDNSDGTAKQCAAYFFGLRDATPTLNMGYGGSLRHKVATAICRDRTRSKHPPRLYVLVKDGQEETLFSALGNYFNGRS